MTANYKTLVALAIGLLILLSVIGLALGQGGTARTNTNSAKPAPRRTTPARKITARPPRKSTPTRPNNKTSGDPASTMPPGRPAEPGVEPRSIDEIDLKLAELRKKRTDLLTVYSSEWPEVKQLDAQIKVLEKQREGLIRKTGADPVLTPPDTRNLQSSDTKSQTAADPPTEKVFRAGEVDQRAQVLEKPPPVYTEEARKNAVTGTVVLRAVLASTGQVANITVVRGLPDGLTERSIAAAKKLKFKPAMKDGKPVSQYVQLQYNLNLY